VTGYCSGFAAILVIGFVDAIEEGITEAGLSRVEPVAGLLEIERRQGAQADLPLQRGDVASGRRAFRSARTSDHGRATLRPARTSPAAHGEAARLPG
jgi:hypothetical protein